MTYRFRQAVKDVDLGTSFQNGFSLGQTKTASTARDTDDFASESELGKSTRDAQRGILGWRNSGRGTNVGGLDVDGHFEG